jgi:uncharacterized protein DUF3137
MTTPDTDGGRPELLARINDLLAAAKIERANRKKKWFRRGAAIGALTAIIIWWSIGLSLLVGFASFIAVTSTIAFIAGLIGYSNEPDTYKQASALAQSWTHEQLGGEFIPKPDSTPQAREALAVKFLPSFDRVNCADLFVHENHWSIGLHLEERRTETTTDSKGRTRTRTYWTSVFQGRVYCLAAPVDFDSTVFVMPRGVGSRMDKQSYSNPQFRKRWNVFSDDGVTAHYVIGPLVSERLVKLKDEDNRLERVAFHEDKLYLAVDDHYRPSYDAKDHNFTMESLEALKGPFLLGVEMWHKIWPGRDLAKATKDLRERTG